MFKFSVKKLFLMISLIAIACVTSFAQGSAKISGTVKDSNDATVQGATVTALNIASSQRTSVQTDSAGKFEFTNLLGGSYRLIASASGFGELAESVRIEDGSSTTQNFQISPGGIKDIVTVTAGKGADRLAVETPQTVSVTSAEQIEQRLPKSTFEAMERAPNLASIESNPARERPKLRGLSSNRLLVVIDGEKLNNARSDPGASGAPIAVVDPSSLQSIEVVAGSGSSLYGSDSVAGTINLITKVPTRPENGTTYSMRLDGNHSSNGRLNRGNLSFNFGMNNFAMRASGGLYRNSNYNMGNQEVTRTEVLSIGNFFRQFPTTLVPTMGCGNQICLQSAASYPIYSLAKNQEIYNGQGSGNRKQLDAWFYPTENHNLRFRYLNSDDGNNGNAFSGPPYETQERYGSFRSFSKFGLRYEVLDIAKWLPRASANYFHQKLSFPQNQYTFNNLNATLGGSYNASTNPNLTSFNGNTSLFGPGSYTDNRNTISTDGMDVQATLAPFRGLFVTVGGGQTKDTSRDTFYTSPFTGFGTARAFTGVATVGSSSPLTTYTDKNFYFQAEFDKYKYVRLTGGMRYDNWITLAVGGNGFPLTSEFALLNAATPGLTASPRELGSLVSALPGLLGIAGGSGTSGSNRKSTTYNFGIVGRFPFGINPYFRWANSYREPGITERYLLRNFTPGLPGLASLVVGNPNLLPEKGKNYDVGIKIAQKYFNFSLGYFRNKITDLLIFSPAQTYCVAPVPGAPGGGAGGCPAVLGVPQLGVQINSRINSSSAEIRGWESTAEASIPLGSLGSMNPFYSLGSLYGRNNNPTALDIAQINAIYSRTNNPIELSGSATDFPLGGITPFRIIYGTQYLNASGRFFAEYNIRHQSKVTRVPPGQFVGTALINHGSFASLAAFNKQSVKAGYNWKTEKYKFSFTGGIDNLADRLFWEHFQNSPAAGRSYVFGFTTEIFNFFKK